MLMGADWMPIAMLRQAPMGYPQDKSRAFSRKSLKTRSSGIIESVTARDRTCILRVA